MAETLARVPIGARRRRFVLELPIEEPDGFGGRLRRYVPGPVLWGAMEPLAEAERLRGGRSDLVATHRVTLRTDPRLTTLMRLAAGPRRFAIRSLTDPDERGRDLVAHVEELLAAPPGAGVFP